jgi:hypothetical protein
MLTGVHVEHHGAGRAAGEVEELGEQHLVDRVTLLLSDRGFQTGEGGLAGEIGAGVRGAADGELEGRIVAQGGGIVGILVTGGDLVDALTDQIEEGVLDALASAGIVKAGGDLLGETEGAVELRQEEEATVGGKGAARESDLNRFTRQQRKVEHGLRIRHWRMFPFCAFS